MVGWLVQVCLRRRWTFSMPSELAPPSFLIPTRLIKLKVMRVIRVYFKQNPPCRPAGRASRSRYPAAEIWRSEYLDPSGLQLPLCPQHPLS